MAAGDPHSFFGLGQITNLKKHRTKDDDAVFCLFTWTQRGMKKAANGSDKGYSNSFVIHAYNDPLVAILDKAKDGDMAYLNGDLRSRRVTAAIDDEPPKPLFLVQHIARTIQLVKIEEKP